MKRVAGWAQLWLMVALAGCAETSSKAVDSKSADGPAIDAVDDTDGTIDATPIDATPIDAMIDATPIDAACFSQNLLVNGDFDNGASAEWMQNSPGLMILTGTDYPPTPHTGAWGAWLGGFTSSVDSLYQDVTIPAGTQAISLSGQQIVATTETLAGVWDTFSISIQNTSGTQLESLYSLNNESPGGANWVGFNAQLTGSYSNQTIRLYLTSSNDSTNHSNFFIDSLALTATICP